MIKPLVREPVRTALTILAVALGVAVVLAIDLAGDAATGSFHSSLETLSGEQNFEVTTTGGIPENLVGKLVSLPYDWRITPRMEDFAILAESKKTVPLIGFDLIAESNPALNKSVAAAGEKKIAAGAASSLEHLTEHESIWIGKMLEAFRWNLQLLSNIALIVGAFLIYNTISVSVVRRRAEIGIARALGASRRQILTAFLGEAVFIGITGALLGIPLGRLMASGAVKLMGATVSALYVTSRPGEIAFTFWSAALALIVGTSVTLISAWSPAHEAA